jgi:hypothetical protein
MFTRDLKNYTVYIMGWKLSGAHQIITNENKNTYMFLEDYETKLYKDTHYYAAMGSIFHIVSMSSAPTISVQDPGVVLPGVLARLWNRRRFASPCLIFSLCWGL